MATTYDNTYSKVIAWLKIVLPLVALVILSTLFLVSNNRNPQDAIPFADVDPAEIAREQRINGPAYSGVTRDGTAIIMSAESARPVPEDPLRYEADQLSATIETPDGGQIDIAAQGGLIDTGNQRAELVGEVELRSSTGYLVQADRVTSTLDATSLVSDGNVRATGPVGELIAGRLKVKQAEDDGEARYLMLFEDGVRLTYDPKR